MFLDNNCVIDNLNKLIDKPKLLYEYSRFVCGKEIDSKYLMKLKLLGICFDTCKYKRLKRNKRKLQLSGGIYSKSEQSVVDQKPSNNKAKKPQKYADIFESSQEEVKEVILYWKSKSNLRDIVITRRTNILVSTINHLTSKLKRFSVDDFKKAIDVYSKFIDMCPSHFVNFVGFRVSLLEFISYKNETRKRMSEKNPFKGVSSLFIVCLKGLPYMLSNYMGFNLTSNVSEYFDTIVSVIGIHYIVLFKRDSIPNQIRLSLTMKYSDVYKFCDSINYVDFNLYVDTDDYSLIFKIFNMMFNTIDIDITDTIDVYRYVRSLFVAAGFNSPATDKPLPFIFSAITRNTWKKLLQNEFSRRSFKTSLQDKIVEDIDISDTITNLKVEIPTLNVT